MTNVMPLLRIEGLVKTFDAPGTRFRARAGRQVAAVDDVSLEINQGETFALVGESGSGKTTLGRCILRLIDATAGTIVFEGVDLTTARAGALTDVRRRMQVVFQDPVGSLDPRMSVRDIVAEPIRTHLRLGTDDVDARVAALLDQVGLGKVHVDRRPHELSGGQCQRVAIARALALSPRLVVLDEPTSSLDVSVQAQILNLLLDLRASLGLTYLLISHDLSVVRHLADRIGVMYRGRIVETGEADDVLGNPAHPYTRALLLAAPALGRRLELSPSTSQPASAVPAGGCRYAPRCRRRVELGSPADCVTQDPHLRPAWGAQFAACHFPHARTPTEPEGAQT